MRLISCEDLKAIIDGVWNVKGSVEIKGVSEISDAGPGDLVYAVDAKRVGELRGSQCGLALVPEGEWELECNHVCVANPYLAFARALSLLDDRKAELEGVHPGAFVDPTAVVEKGAILYPNVYVGRGSVIGSGTILYPNVTIMEDVSIGEDCIFYSNVTVREECVIQDRVILQSGCVIGSDGYGFVFDSGVHHKIPQIGNVVIECDVELGANVTVDRGTFRSTIIGSGTKIDNQVQIAHNVVMGKGCLMASQSGLSGSTKVGNFVTFGGQSGSVGHIEIGDGSVIYARGVATSPVPPGTHLSGFPGRPHKEELKTLAVSKRLPKLIQDVRRILKHLNLK